MNSFDPLKFPFPPQSLIEASAGTGKTYALAALYLRLVLGVRTGFPPLSPQQILVVTFTNAATQELRGRIRERLLEVREVLQGNKSNDPFLISLAAEVENDEALLLHVELALRSLDEAQISTLHTFCLRLLASWPMEAGGVLGRTLTREDERLLFGAVIDIWRHCYQLPFAKRALASLGDRPSPSSLLEIVGKAVRNVRLQVVPKCSADWERVAEDLDRLTREVKKEWLTLGRDLEGLLTSYGVSGSAYRSSDRETRFARLDPWMRAENSSKPPPDVIRFYLEETIRGAVKDRDIEIHPFFKKLSEMNAGHVALKQSFLFWCIEETKMRITQRKRSEGILALDDAQQLVLEALSSARGSYFAESIARKHSVALIDEFQDTDEVQWGIFRRIYGRERLGTSSQVATALVLIGDPKQAIYSFRGADIFTWFAARNSIDSTNRYTLEKNWRSTPPMIAAINSLFSLRKQPFVLDGQIDFLPVMAGQTQSGVAESLIVNGQVVPALQILIDRDLAARDNGRGKGQSCLARASAQIIACWLEMARSGQAQINGRALLPKDIALLVRSHQQAVEMRELLAEYGIGTSYLGKQSVFQTTEALDLEILLQAVVEPKSETRLLSALSTATLALPASELILLANGSGDILGYQQLFDECFRLWQEDGFLPMFWRLLSGLKIIGQAARAASLKDERLLTNLLHLGELLQEQSLKVHGVDGLLNYLRTSISGEGSESDEAQLRLESDEELISIITIHRSKGLEFEVVFLPFLWEEEIKLPDVFHDAEGQLIFPLGELEKNDKARFEELARKEALAEDLRLLYVALTRAKRNCIVGLGLSKRLRTNGFGYLLDWWGGKKDKSAVSWEEFEKTFAKLISDVSSSSETGFGNVLAYCQVSEDDVPLLSAEFTAKKTQLAERSVPLFARTAVGYQNDGWGRTSYSQIVKGSGERREQQKTFPVDSYWEDSDALPGEEEQESTLPRGPLFGNLVHRILEIADFQLLASTECLSVIAREAKNLGLLTLNVPELARLFNATVTSRLFPDSDFSLVQLETRDLLREFEFSIFSQGFSLEKLNSAITQYGNLEGSLSLLSGPRVYGMLNGFVDLFFRSEGRYYIVDYKTNFLGSSVQNYDRPALTAEMGKHRYDLQYLLYTLAVHRYLSIRKRGYDYRNDFGGVFYLFLRGLTPQGDPEFGVYFDRPRWELIGALDRIFGGEENVRNA